MVHSSAACQGLLDALVASPIAWQTPSQLAARLGLDLDSTHEIIADLDAEGWLDPWDMGATLFVTLSPRAVDQLRVCLVAVGRSEAMRWASVDDPEPIPPRPLTRDQGGMTLLDLVADPGPDPSLVLEAAERAERIAASKKDAGEAGWIDFLPRPTILLGLGLSPWPGPVRNPDQACAGCQSGPISESAYCLVCDRWGLDHFLNGDRKSTKVARPRRIATPNPPGDDQEKTNAAKLARKAKRRRRRDVQIERQKSQRRPASQ